jgi:hypothetical protein
MSSLLNTQYLIIYHYNQPSTIMHLMSILTAMPVLSIVSLDLVPGVRASSGVEVATSQDTCQVCIP